MAGEITLDVKRWQNAVYLRRMLGGKVLDVLWMPAAEWDALLAGLMPGGVTLTRDQLEAWAGRPLADDEIEQLDECIPNSSIPEAIATIASQFEDEGDDE